MQRTVAEQQSGLIGGTIDQIFVIRQNTERYAEYNKCLAVLLEYWCDITACQRNSSVY